MSEKTRKKMSEISKKLGLKPPSRKGVIGEEHPFFGKHHTIEARQKISDTHLNKHPWNYAGSKNRTERQIAMAKKDYILWRTAVFMRDDYTCQKCGERGGQLQADHIKPWALYEELRYAIDNGRTLCISCHRSADTWGARVYSAERLIG